MFLLLHLLSSGHCGRLHLVADLLKLLLLVELWWLLFDGDEDTMITTRSQPATRCVGR